MLLAQANIALFRWPLDDHRMSAFAEQIQPVNAFAEQSRGFVWRFTDEFVARNLGSPWNDPLLFFNMSVWRDFDSLHQFVRCDAHREIVRERERWTEPAAGPPMAMWWIEDAVRPSVEDRFLRRRLRNTVKLQRFSIERLSHLRIVVGDLLHEDI